MPQSMPSDEHLQNLVRLAGEADATVADLYVKLMKVATITFNLEQAGNRLSRDGTKHHEWLEGQRLLSYADQLKKILGTDEGPSDGSQV